MPPLTFAEMGHYLLAVIGAAGLCFFPWLYRQSLARLGEPRAAAALLLAALIALLTLAATQPFVAVGVVALYLLGRRLLRLLGPEEVPKSLSFADVVSPAAAARLKQIERELAEQPRTDSPPQFPTSTHD